MNEMPRGYAIFKGKCKICGKEFKRYKNCINHVMKMHNLEFIDALKNSEKDFNYGKKCL
jgi:uncharacterized C2H2 Zn-finger protein